jgi:hypothetical protein
MPTRLERVVDKLAERYAPALLADANARQTSGTVTQLQYKARQLAKHDIVVLTGTMADELVPLKDLHIQDWVQCHYLLYHTLARTLFPSYLAFDARYADRRLPPIIVLRGEATPVMEVLAGFVVPYISLRQNSGDANDEEHGLLMDAVLDALAADDLPEETCSLLKMRCIDLLNRLLNTSIHHVAVTTFDRPILDWMRQHIPRPSSLPEQPLPNAERGEEMLAYELETLPEDDQPAAQTQEMFIYQIMIENRRQTGKTGPLTDTPSDQDKSSSNQ